MIKYLTEHPWIAPIIAALITAWATLFPKYLHSRKQRKKEQEELLGPWADTLRKESQQIKEDLKKEIAELRLQVEELEIENEKLEVNNTNLQNRVSELELQVTYYEFIAKANGQPTFPKKEDNING